MNKFGSAILFDVGCRKLSTSENSFFASSKRCLSRLILRKMFSDDGDDMGVILFGSEVTENCMPEREQGKYSNIRELFQFGKANFQKYDAIEAITQCKGYKSDWVLTMIVALEYLRQGTQGKRYKMKQIVIFSEFPTVLEYNESIVSTIAGCMKNQNVNLIVVGPEIDRESEYIPENLKLVIKLFELLDDPLSLSLDELAGSIKYFEKKRKTKRIFNVNLEIGSTIQIPVGWIKLTSESQRFSNWVDRSCLERMKREEDRMSQQDGSSSENLLDAGLDFKEEPDIYKKRYGGDTVMEEDMFKVTKFGRTQVTLSSADLRTLKRESGPASFKILMFTQRKLVNPTMYIGNDIFAVIPQEKSNFSQAKLFALIDAMIEKDKVAIARRIVMNNGKVQLGALIPFSHDSGKDLYFLKLPTAEWVQPYPRYRDCPVINPSLKEKFKNLINSMRLPQDLEEEGQGILVHDPHFQLRSHLFAERALNPKYDITETPEYIKDIFNPCSQLKENAREILKSILVDLPSLNTELRSEITDKRALSKSDKVKQEKYSGPSNSVVIKSENTTNENEDFDSIINLLSDSVN